MSKIEIERLYEKYNSECIKSKRSKDKLYSAKDIRVAIEKIFDELDEKIKDDDDRKFIRMNVLKNIIKSTNEKKFKDLRYQEVRSVVKSKNFKKFTLENIDDSSVCLKVE